MFSCPVTHWLTKVEGAMDEVKTQELEMKKDCTDTDNSRVKLTLKAVGRTHALEVKLVLWRVNRNGFL